MYASTSMKNIDNRMDSREEELKPVNSSAQQYSTTRKSSRKKTLEFTEEDEAQQNEKTMQEKTLVILLFLLLVALIGVVVLFLVDHKVIQIFGSGKEATPAPEEKEFCLTKGCIQAASKLDSNIDYSVKPCDNFYKFACGRWIKETVLPQDKSSMISFYILHYKNDIKLKALLEQPIKPEELSSIKKAKTLYASCIDEETITTKGDTSLKSLLISQLGGWPLTHASWNESQFDFLTTFSKVMLLGVNPVVMFAADIDQRNSSRKTLTIDQPYFGMPGAKYYLVARNDTMLLAYENFILSVARLLGLANPATSKEDVGALVDFEIQLANISVPAEERRDQNLLYNPMTVEELQKKYSEIFNWTKLVFNTMSLPEIGVGVTDKEIIINHSPQYFERLIPILQNTTKRTLANYLIWRFVRPIIERGTLGGKYEDLVNLYYQALYGTSTPTPRFESCVSYVTWRFALVVGRMFVKDNFDPDSKVKVLDMIDELKKAFNELLEDVDWMDETTKQNAEEKTEFIAPSIGYPDHVYNDKLLEDLYFNVSFKKDAFFENVLNYARFSTYKEFRDLRVPNDKESWDFPASVVSAYYSDVKNQIVFTAGILQPPFYSKTSPMSLNFGGIGMVIGHEITHGFDDRGRMVDKFGNLFNWWSSDAEAMFKAKSQCLIDQYGNFTLEQINMNLNGKLTLGENIADNGGMKQSFRAYRNWVKARGSEEKQLPGLNFTNNQLFFINFAQLWCEIMTDNDAVRKIRTYTHSPGEFRANGPLQNSKDFAEAFNCPVGSYMNPPNKCSVW